MAAEMIRRTRIVRFTKSLIIRYEDLAKTMNETSDLKNSDYAKGVLTGRSDFIDLLIKEFKISEDELKD